MPRRAATTLCFMHMSALGDSMCHHLVSVSRRPRLKPPPPFRHARSPHHGRRKDDRNRAAAGTAVGRRKHACDASGAVGAAGDVPVRVKVGGSVKQVVVHSICGSVGAAGHVTVRVVAGGNVELDGLIGESGGRKSLSW
eukprot:357215-Chlamydomonas_euryale.AAC.3